MSKPVDIEDVLRALLVADDDHRHTALQVLQGDLDFETKRRRGPLLLGMGEAAKFLGISRPTLWRMIQAGRLERVELMPGSYRIRRSDLEALAEES